MRFFALILNVMFFVFNGTASAKAEQPPQEIRGVAYFNVPNLKPQFHGNYNECFQCKATFTLSLKSMDEKDGRMIYHYRGRSLLEDVVQVGEKLYEKSGLYLVFDKKENRWSKLQFYTVSSKIIDDLLYGTIWTMSDLVMELSALPATGSKHDAILTNRISDANGPFGVLNQDKGLLIFE